MKVKILANSNRIISGECIIGIIYVLLEISIVIGESFGWINYDLEIDSFLFIIFLVLIISYKNKKNEEIEVKKYE